MKLRIPAAASRSLNSLPPPPTGCHCPHIYAVTQRPLKVTHSCGWSRGEGVEEVWRRSGEGILGWKRAKWGLGHRNDAPARDDPWDHNKLTADTWDTCHETVTQAPRAPSKECMQPNMFVMIKFNLPWIMKWKLEWKWTLLFQSTRLLLIHLSMLKLYD